MEVLDDATERVLSVLREGQIFGELSVLRIPGNKSQNRRTATIRSLGFSELYRLRKNDLWDVILQYPNAKEKLVAKGQRYTVSVLRCEGTESMPTQVLDCWNEKIYWRDVLIWP